MCVRAIILMIYISLAISDAWGCAADLFGPQLAVSQPGPCLGAQNYYFTADRSGNGYELVITNGDQGKSPVTSAEISLNGCVIFRPNDFSPRKRLLLANVALCRKNVITAKINGAPGTALSILVREPACCGATLYGPQRFVRENGKPATWMVPITLSDVGLTFTLTLLNGKQGGSSCGSSDRVTSATVKWNQATVWTQTDFKNSAARLDKSVPVNAGTNTLTVSIASAPGSEFTILLTAIDQRSNQVRFSAATTRTSEAAGTINIPIVLDRAALCATRVGWSLDAGTATADADYRSASGVLVIPAGTTTASIPATILQDALPESDETFQIALVNVQGLTIGNPNCHTVTIADDDTAVAPPVVQWTIATSQSTEQVGTAQVSLTLDRAAPSPVTITYQVAGTANRPQDHGLANGTLSIPAGATTATITVPIVDDALDETDESVIVTLTGATAAMLGATTVHTLTILDNDAPPSVAFALVASQAGEATGSSAIGVTLSAASGLPVTVTYHVSGTANQPQDHGLANGALSIPAGATTATITVPIVDDALDETDETVIVTLTGATAATLGATTVHTLTILDNDAPPSVAFAQAASSLGEADGTAAVVVCLSERSGLPVTVAYSLAGTASAADYQATPGTLTIPPGQLNVVIPILVINDQLDEPDESILVTLSAPTQATLNAPITHSVTIVDDDAPPTVTFATATSTADEAAGNLSIPVTLSAPSGQAITVTYSVGGTAQALADHDLIAGTCTIPAGSLTGTLAIAINDDVLDESDETAIITLTGATNATLGAIPAHTLTITDNDQPPQVAFVQPTSTADESAGTVDMTLSLSTASGLPITVTYAVSGSSRFPDDHGLSAGSAIFAPGSLTAQIHVPLVDDTLAEDSETVVVRLTSATSAILGGANEHVLTIADTDVPPTIAFALPTSISDEGAGSALVDVTLSGPSGQTITAQLALAGTADANDHGQVATTVTIPAGALSAQVTIPLIDDSADEPDEILVLTLAAPTSASLGMLTQHTLTITDNDLPPVASFSTATASTLESTPNITIAVVLDVASSMPVSIPVLLSGTATFGADHQGANTVLTIAPGQLNASFIIPLLDDAVYEGDETMVATLGVLNNARPGDPSVEVITIRDDEPLPTLRFEQLASIVAENAGQASVVVTLSGASTSSVTAQVQVSGTATADADFTPPAALVTILAGALTATITVPILDDLLVEGDETVQLGLSFPAGADLGTPAVHTLTIASDDLFQVRPIAECYQNNGDGTVTVFFGYDNPQHDPVNLPIGGNNHFAPGTNGRGQPVVYLPGRSPVWPNHPFSVVISEPILTWWLTGLSAVADSHLPLAPTPPRDQTLPSAPVVRFVSPPDATLIASGQPLTIALDAYDLDGLVLTVVVRDGGAAVATLVPVPGHALQLSLPGLPAGDHVFTAIATDDLGLTGASAPLTVQACAPPTITLSSAPAGPLAVDAAALITATITSSAAISDVTFARADLPVLTLHAPPWQFAIPGAVRPQERIQAQVRDANGLSATAELILAVNLAPSVTVVHPQGTELFQPVPEGIPLVAVASDVDGEVRTVAFTVNGVPVGTATASPWRVLWQPDGANPITVVAIATDDAGATTVSSPVTVTINRLPDVTITSPLTDVLLRKDDADLTITAEANDADGSITATLLLINGERVEEVTTSSITWPFSGAVPGVYDIAAETFDDRGGYRRSATRRITVNADPTCEILSPAPGTIVDIGTPITLHGVGHDSDGTINSCEFWIDGQLVGSVHAGEAQVSWSPTHSGSHQVELRVEDNVGSVARVAQTIVGNALPVVTIRNPTIQAVIVEGEGWTIDVDAFDSDGSIIGGVTLALDGVEARTDTVLPYSFNLPGHAAGPVRMTLTTHDDHGSLGQAERTIVINARPTVTIVQPFNQAVVAEQVPFTMQATASDSDDQVVTVEWHWYVEDGAFELFGSSTAPNFTRQGSLPNGYYHIFATPIDERGTRGQSQAVTIRVNRPPTVTVSSSTGIRTLIQPADLVISAMISDDTSNQLASVELFQDSVSLGAMTPPAESWQPWQSTISGLQPGTYVFTVRATDLDGGTTLSQPFHQRVKAVNLPPTVAINNPPYGSVVTDPSEALDLVATAIDPDGTVVTVRYAYFRDGGPAINVGSSSNPPYVIPWIAPGPGTYDLMATATDDEDAIGTSTAVRVVVGTPPTATLVIADAPGQPYVPAVGIALRADASDSDGTVVRVDFLMDGELIGSDLAAPFTLQWLGASATPHTLEAVVYDDQGLSAHSNGIRITLNEFPRVRILTPGRGQPFVEGETITVDAEITDHDGSVAQAVFRLDGAPVSTLTAPPWRVTLPALAVGEHSVSIAATDDRGGTTTSTPVAFRINGLPQVALTAPTAGTILQEGALVVLDANASDPEGALAGVEFRAGQTFLGGDSTPPYSIATVLTAGSHQLTARAIDALGGSQTSVAVQVTVNARPLVSLSAPAAGAQVTYGSPIQLAAVASDPDGSVTRVDFYDGAVFVGSSSSAPFSVAIPSAAAGTHVLSAVAFDDRGGQATSAARVLAVNPPGTIPPTLTLISPQPNAVLPVGDPITVEVTVSDSDGTVANVAVYDGATLLTTLTAAPWQYVWPAPSAGRHVLSITATDDAGSTSTISNLVVTVNPLPVVAIIDPAPGSIVHAPADVTVTIAASDDGQLAAVELLDGATVLGSASITPNGSYTLTLSQLPAGTLALRARARDNRGAVTLTSAQTLIVNAKPVLTLVAPQADPVITLGSPLLVNATVSDSDGTPSRLTVDIDGSTVATLTNEPWQVSVNGLPAGQHRVLVTAFDERGGTTTSAPILITVNQLPGVTLTAPAGGSLLSVGQATTLAALAYDPDGPVSRIEFLADGTLIGSDATAPYTAAWTPTTSGPVALTARVIDAAGAIALSTPVTVTVNARPVVAFTAPLQGAVLPTATSVAITLNASDSDGTVTVVRVFADNQPLAELTSAPYTVTWALPNDGVHALTAVAVDDRGAVSVTALRQCTVGNANAAPLVALTQPDAGSVATIGHSLTLSATASDPDGAIHHVTFLANGIEIATTTTSPYTATWQPDVLGDIALSAEAVDAGGRSTLSSPRTVRVAPATAEQLAIVITLPLAGSKTSSWSWIQATATVSNAVAMGLVEWYVDGVFVGNATNGPTWERWLSPLALGNHVLTAHAVDYGQTAWSAPVTIHVGQDDGSYPSVALTAPADSAVVAFTAPITGHVTTSNPATDIVSWQVTLAELPDGAPTIIASGSGPVDGALGTLDATMHRNGYYSLGLQGWDGQGRSISTERTVRIDGQAKVGEFSISQTDLVIPVSGIPLALVRTYRSFERTQTADFGYGWSYSLLDPQVTFADRRAQALDGNFDYFSLRTGGSRDVTLTLPDTGKRVTFHFDLAPAGIGRLQAIWRADDGVSASLRSSVSCFQVALFGFVRYWEALGLASELEAFDVPGYVLTLSDGTSYRFSRQDLGEHLYQTAQGREAYTHVYGRMHLDEIVQPSGDRIAVGTDRIDHFDPSGTRTRGLTFVRDAQGRIIAAYDPVHQLADGTPSGPAAVRYGYDAAGDLVSSSRLVADVGDQGLPVYETVEYRYENAQFPHYLTQIIDPRGTPVRMDYDADGRLAGITDAQGNRTALGHDLDGRRETVTDRLGHTRTLVYDGAGNVTAETDALGHTTTRTYDSRGNVLAETDPLGRTTLRTYDSAGRVTSTTDALGHTTSTTYDARGNVLTQTDAFGRTVSTNVYDGANRLVSSRDALGHTTTYGYDGNGNLTTETDALGQVTTYGYAGNNLMTLTDALGHVTSFGYDANGNQISMGHTRTREDGTVVFEVTQMAYDSQGRVTRVEGSDGAVTRTTYTATGQVGAVMDALGHVTTYGYDTQGNLTAMAFADGTAEATSYDAEGRRTAHRDRMGRVTRFFYDAAGRLDHVQAPDGTTSRTTYDAAGQVIASRDALGRTTTFRYDVAGRRTAVIDALGQISTYTLDANGAQTAVTDASGQTTQFTIDILGRTTSTRMADGTVVSTDYDALGRRVTETDQLHRVTRFGYDALGRLIEVDDAAHQFTRYAYDEVGNQITQTDALGRATRYAYDGSGRRVARTLPLGQREAYAYDLGGNLTAYQNFRGLITTRSYDLMNRVIAVIPPAGSGEATIAYTYLADGRRHTMSDQLGVTTYTYDGRGRLTQKAGPTGTLHYDFDAAGALTDLHTGTAGGAAMTYAYDGLGRMASVTSPGYGTTTYGYDPAGTLARVRAANGVTTAYRYDALHRLTDVTASRLDASPVASWRYTLGVNGRREAVQELSGRTVAYQYDSLDRLTQETIQGVLPGQVSGTIGYTHDAVGNRLTRTSNVAGVASQTFTYDDNDRVTADAFDADGNTVSTVAHGSDQYTSANKLSRRIRPDGMIIDLVYDGDGNKVQEIVTTPPATISDVATVVTTTFLIDTMNPTGYAQTVEEWRGMTLAKTYVVGLDMVAQREVATNAVHTFGYDGHGSVRYLTDAGGDVTDTFEYDAYGILIASTGTTDNRYLYAGEEFMADLDLYYSRARLLDAGKGRFHTRDEYEGDGNLYNYTGGNPVGRIDPSGNFSIGEVMTAISMSPVFQGSSISLGIGFAAMSNASELVLNRSTRTMLIMAWMAGPDDSYVVTLMHEMMQFHESMSATMDAVLLAIIAVDMVNLGATVYGVLRSMPQMVSGVARAIQGARSITRQFFSVVNAGISSVANFAKRLFGFGKAKGGTRLPQDISVRPQAPRALPLNRPIGLSQTQNARLQQDISDAQQAGGRDFRVNQQQVNATGQRVGINRPDLQYTDASGNRVYVEYDIPGSGRGPGHRVRINANDPDGTVNLVIQP